MCIWEKGHKEQDKRDNKTCGSKKKKGKGHSLGTSLNFQSHISNAVHLWCVYGHIKLGQN